MRGNQAADARCVDQCHGCSQRRRDTDLDPARRRYLHIRFTVDGRPRPQIIRRKSDVSHSTGEPRHRIRLARVREHQVGTGGKARVDGRQARKAEQSVDERRLTPIRLPDDHHPRQVRRRPSGSQDGGTGRIVDLQPAGRCIAPVAHCSLQRQHRTGQVADRRNEGCGPGHDENLPGASSGHEPSHTCPGILRPSRPPSQPAGPACSLVARRSGWPGHRART